MLVLPFLPYIFACNVCSCSCYFGASVLRWLSYLVCSMHLTDYSNVSLLLFNIITHVLLASSIFSVRVMGFFTELNAKSTSRIILKCHYLRYKNVVPFCSFLCHMPLYLMRFLAIHYYAVAMFRASYLFCIRPACPLH